MIKVQVKPLCFPLFYVLYTLILDQKRIIVNYIDVGIVRRFPQTINNLLTNYL